MARDFVAGAENVNYGDNLEPTNMSCMAWVRVDTAAAFNVALAKNYTTTSSSPYISYGKGLRATSQYSCYVAVGTTLYPAESAVIAVAGDKKFIGGTYDGETVTVFINGGTATNTSPSGNLAYSTGLLKIANNANDSNDWVGPIGECAIWSADIGSTKMQALERGVNPFVMRDDIQLFYQPVWGNDSPEVDYTGRLSGTVSGGTKANWHPPVEHMENYL